MGKFYFQAVTKNGKTVSGSVISDTESEARTKLAQNGLAILSITKGVPQKDKNSDVTLFYFKAINQEQKKVHGTIEAVDRYDAYRKLRSEYYFNVLYVVADNLPPGEKQVLKLKGIESELVARYKEETSKSKHETKKMSRDEKVELIVQLQEQQIGAIRNEISEIIKKVELLLEKNGKYIDKTKNREIKERIDLLARLRQSNSIAHLQNLTRNVLFQLASDALFLEATEIPDETPEEVEKRKKEFQTNIISFQKDFEKSLESIQMNLGNIDSKLLGKQIISMHLPQKIGKFLFWIFFLLTDIFILFWIFNAFRTIVRLGGEGKVNFYFHSGMFWYFTGVSALISVIFAPLIFSKRSFSWVTQCVIFSTAIFAVFIFSFEFPAICRWV